jgi:phosphodiesterase/alkaline phosphatase D-like protein
LPDAGRPTDLPGSGAPDRPDGVSECYGTLRYGRLLEALLFESRRFTTLTGTDAVMIHPEAEKWLIDRMSAEEATHVVNMPATIFGWSAGKWMEWYPDARNEQGSLTTDESKYMWQEGWFAQHNRILEAASRMKSSIPLFICGDLHSQAEGRIMQSGDLDLRSNPIIAVSSGSLGTGPRGFPSGFRGMLAEVPGDLVVEERLPIVEKNGFIIADFTPEKITISFYAWKPPEPVEAIDDLQPFHVLELRR